MALMKFREPNQVKWMGLRPGHNGTQVRGYISVDNADAIVYTVPADKTFYLCSLTLGYLALAAGVAEISLRNAADAFLCNFLRDVIVATSSGRSQSLTFWPPMEITSLYDIFIKSNAAGLQINGFVFGWYEPPP